MITPEVLWKRIKGSLWVAFAGFTVTVFGLVLENLDALNLTESQQLTALIVGTAIVSSITKQLNSAK